MQNISQIEDELKAFNRRLERVEKKLDLIDSDRGILEDILGRMSQMTEVWKATRQHDDAVRKDLKEEIQSSGDRVVASVETKIEGLQAPRGSRKKHKAWYKFWEK